MDADQRERIAMTWISTANGHKIDFLNPEPSEIEIDDIAAGLAAMPRWAGQTLYRGEPCHYSVAQHSWHVSIAVAEEYPDSPRLALMALLHDATEAFMGDCPRPLKNLLGPTWNVIELRLLVAIFNRYGLTLDRELAPQIKRVDDRMLMTERRDLQPLCPPWESGPWPDPYELTLSPWDVAMARNQFLRRFNKLHLTIQSERPAA
jgi:hypothetical protein